MYCVAYHGVGGVGGVGGVERYREGVWRCEWSEVVWEGVRKRCGRVVRWCHWCGSSDLNVCV